MKVWKFILEKISASQKVMLLCVLQSKGSSPGRRGFKMAVAEDGSLCGSVGGGVMEHKLAELSKNILTTGGAYRTVHRQHHSKQAAENRSGMICSGEQVIYLHLFKKEEITDINKLLLSLENNENGTLTLSNNRFAFSPAAPLQNFYFEIGSEDEFLYKEKTGFKNRLVIIGGGHCALALSKLMSGMDFFITVVEERAGLNTLEENSFAHQKIMVNSFSDLDHAALTVKESYVVIMTAGYRTDMLVLGGLVHQHPRYIGLLGSKKKIENIFDDDFRKRVSPEELALIHSPAGIQIKSETPEEIAVSIAAEIISVKNNQ